MYLQEEVVTYEVAKLASEAGFKSFTRSYYMIGDKEPFFVEEAKNWNVHYDRYSAPTQSLLQRWLREDKGYAISVTAYPTLASLNKVCYAWEIKSSSDGYFMKSTDSEYTFSTYELALEDALKFALENLVKI